MTTTRTRPRRIIPAHLVCVCVRKKSMNIIKCGLRIDAVAVGLRPYEMSECGARIAMQMLGRGRLRPRLQELRTTAAWTEQSYWYFWHVIQGEAAIIASVGNAAELCNARQFAAWLDLAPRQHSTGAMRDWTASPRAVKSTYEYSSCRVHARRCIALRDVRVDCRNG